MQSLVMDGVRRTSGVNRPETLVLGKRRERPQPLVLTTVPKLGLDGVRRASAPTPRELLEAMNLVAPALPQADYPAQSYARPKIAFSLIAAALMIAAISGGRYVPKFETVKPIAKSAIPRAASVAAIKPDSAPLQHLADSFVAAHGSQYTIYIKDLKDGRTASVNAGQVMESASLYKLFVAQRIYQMADNAELSYSQTAGSESGQSVGDCLAAMITISDNACGTDLWRTIGYSKQDPILKTSGYTSTTLGDDNNPQLTDAKDVGLLLERLYSGTLMSPNSTQRFVGLLKGQTINDRFSTGLPAGAVIAHKTGDLDGYTHDAAIIYGPKTDFVVVVMSGPWGSPEAAKPAFGDLAGQLYSYFNN